MTTDLVAWLCQQLDADERVALAAPPGPWTTPGPDTIAEWTVYDEHWAVAHAAAYDHDEPMSNKPGARGPGYIDANATAEHIARHDPARVLAEVDAKRRILDAHEAALREHDGEGWAWDSESERARSETATLAEVVKLLALPYADRPGYREEWRPTEDAAQREESTR